MWESLFLVTGVVVTSEYMCNADVEVEEHQLVMASSEGEAEVIFSCFYTRKSDNYGITYSVRDVKVRKVVTLKLTNEEKEKYSWKLN